eukprot:CAMPEP_0177596326 /NCGR_PEP_ID=MMETSP0419_2-20121207/10978_1 /TAXON_ID=582737 /ORGANISM="Tetraselmis sp., Strain GSL018" /LENGTH=109 /DNA_ID=CAMNT_0019088141 /DNA_START=369 /DNA_END=698 /DNA_ORIENTATION=-
MTKQRRPATAAKVWEGAQHRDGKHAVHSVQPSSQILVQHGERVCDACANLDGRPSTSPSKHCRSSSKWPSEGTSQRPLPARTQRPRQSGLGGGKAEVRSQEAEGAAVGS